MAGYFIEELQWLHPTSLVAYFFCRSGVEGLTKAREMFEVFAYQCIQDSKDALSALDLLRCHDTVHDRNSKNTLIHSCPSSRLNLIKYFVNGFL